ncbi:MAG TPA: glycoside hydrolase domain-containing protein [Planctomycetota bacterium]|nr:glycoside hydrolase domain-containing protein [Planctomycetota bacterium]
MATGIGGRERAGGRWMAALAGCVLAWAGPGLSAVEIKIPDNKDVWISAANREEADENMGAASRMKLKVWQEYGLLDFDLTELKGKKIKSAELYIFPDSEKGARTPLHWITLSTVTSPWEEGKSDKYGKDEEGHGATFNEASYKTRPWAWPGSKAYDVMLGNGNSMREETELSDAGGGWWKMPVRKEQLESLVAGGSYGLMIMDGSTGVNMNTMIYQREQNGKGPYLLVQVEGEDKAAPAAVSGLKVTPEPNSADVDSGAVTFAFTCPDEVAALEIKLDGKDLPRYQIPQPKKGPMQFSVIDLPAAKAVKVAVVAVDGAGNRSPEATAQVTTSPAITVPKLPAPSWTPKGGAVPTIGGALKVWGIPELVKTEPATGAAKYEGKNIDYAQKNAVFDGATSTVHLSAARAEIASFQLVFEAVKGELKDIVIAVGDLKNGDKTISKAGVKCWRIWYVEKEAEYCVPLTKSFDIPAADNKVQGQKTQQVTIDYFIPKDTAPGLYTGEIAVTAADGVETKLPLEIKVFSAVIPDELNFNPELNCYGGPGRAGTEEFLDYHRLAHYNRCTLNRVPYSQSGNVHGDMAPKVDAAGKVTDWSAYDASVGPLLTGSAFKDNPRAGVPVRTFYLPMFESWPLSWRGHYNPGPDATVPEPKGNNDNWKDTHDTYAKPISECFDATYKQAFTNCVKDFMQHFEQKGYTHTACEMYLNNKFDKSGGKASSLWTLDEPYEALDWYVLRYYSDLYHEGAAGAKRPDWFVFRGDISRPEWQGSYMDGRMEYMYCNSGSFAMSRLVTATQARNHLQLYIYGSANPPQRNDYESTAWCYKAWFMQGSGVLPWQSLGGADKLQKFDKESIEALLVDGKQFGVSAVASLRVHAMRRGAQDAELMQLLQKKQGWARAHLDALVSQKLALTSEFKQARQDDAAAVIFTEIPSGGFAEVKDGLLQLLEK